MIAAKIGSGTVSGLMHQNLGEVTWPKARDAHKDHLFHFLAGFAICTENRNHLMHSAMAWEPGEKPILFKTSKQGNVIMAVPTVEELRRVADDMHAYTIYGRMVGNAINNSFSEPSTFPISAFPWPDKPHQPHKMDYSSDLRQM